MLGRLRPVAAAGELPARHDLPHGQGATSAGPAPRPTRSSASLADTIERQMMTVDGLEYAGVVVHRGHVHA
ncbi:MAG: hypothetical protein MZU91_12575 [Desulfosudis oleivorans]|nr:hypothetical protein [Desulfosudis oleivorans]